MQRIAPILLALLFLIPVACDSNNMEDGISSLAGEYDFTEFQFIPDSNLLEPVNLLDTLVVTSTQLQIFSAGRFTLLYEFRGGSSKFVGGDAHRTDRGVRLSGAREDEEIFSDLLLPIEFELRSEGSILMTQEDRRVNLEAYSNRYRGLPSVEGTLSLTLSR